MFARNTILFTLLAALLSTVTAGSHSANQLSRRHHSLANRSVLEPIANRGLHRRCQPRRPVPTTSSVEPTPTPTPEPEKPEPTPEPVQELPKIELPKEEPPKEDNNNNNGNGGGSSGVGFMDGTNHGKATFYSAGLGACGIVNNDSDYIVAVSHLLFDSFPGAGNNPNTNPVCNKRIIATVNGKDVNVAVTDRCEACAIADLDFTPNVFQSLIDQSVGRTDLSWRWA